jgi:hypothetical protein
MNAYFARYEPTDLDDDNGMLVFLGIFNDENDANTAADRHYLELNDDNYWYPKVFPAQAGDALN